MRVIDAIITRMKRKSTDVAADVDVDFDADAAGIRDRNRNCIRNLYYLYNEQTCAAVLFLLLQLAHSLAFLVGCSVGVSNVMKEKLPKLMFVGFQNREREKQ